MDWFFVGDRAQVAEEGRADRVQRRGRPDEGYAGARGDEAGGSRTSRVVEELAAGLGHGPEDARGLPAAPKAEVRIDSTRLAGDHGSAAQRALE